MPWDDQFEYKFNLNESEEDSLSDAKDSINQIIKALC